MPEYLPATERRKLSPIVVITRENGEEEWTPT